MLVKILLMSTAVELPGETEKVLGSPASNPIWIDVEACPRKGESFESDGVMGTVEAVEWQKYAVPVNRLDVQKFVPCVSVLIA